MTTSLNTFGHFYSTYKNTHNEFDQTTFECAERTVKKLLAFATSSDHPGMLLGKVQSGKTRTFISIIALAFDNGFDFAIVLSKNSKALIEQTTKRLASEFRKLVENNDLSIYDIMLCPDRFTKQELESKLIFVAKKQDDNLRRLTDLFESKSPAMKSHRVLIIDDEADNASVGFNKKGEAIEAKKISSQISNLRSAIDSVSFLQVTATPYSLYLQPVDTEVANVIDFKPTRPAFTELVPVPAEYVGGDTYFGESAKSDTPTIESLIHFNVDSKEIDRLKRPDA